MPKLVIASIGPASSVQDGGRPGSQRYGLPPSGVMDRLSLAAANVLVGNAPMVRNADGDVDVLAAVAGAPALVEAGVTDVRFTVAPPRDRG